MLLAVRRHQIIFGNSGQWECHLLLIAHPAPAHCKFYVLLMMYVTVTLFPLKVDQYSDCIAECQDMSMTYNMQLFNQNCFTQWRIEVYFLKQV